MANIRKCFAGSEAASDALAAILNLAMVYPKKGTHVGGGNHCSMPETWDGNGPTPPGWSKNYRAVYVASTVSAAIPISDADAAELQHPAVLARLTAQQQTTLANAIAARANVDLEAGAFLPKVSGAVAAPEEVKA
jgi:hypothetical protein